MTVYIEILKLFLDVLDMHLSLNSSAVIKLKLFTHEQTQQSYVGVRAPLNGTDSKCHIFAPCWNYSVSSYKTTCDHENCFKARKQNARILSFIAATDHKSTSKRNIMKASTMP